jgi:molybdopterin synthase sulfur carrier subunit
LADITLTGQMTVDDFTSTDILKDHLVARFPQLSAARYFLAVNQQMIEGNQQLNSEDTVALMPPFSGG